MCSDPTMDDAIEIQITSRDVLYNDLVPRYLLILIRNYRNVYWHGQTRPMKTRMSHEITMSISRSCALRIAKHAGAQR